MLTKIGIAISALIIITFAECLLIYQMAKNSHKQLQRIKKLEETVYA